jgi:hypothetical protein
VGVARGDLNEGIHRTGINIIASHGPRSLPDLDLFAILLGRVGGLIDSRDVLAELAKAIPAFAVARGGRISEFGFPLSRSETGPPVRRFIDPWMGFGKTRAGRIIKTDCTHESINH